MKTVVITGASGNLGAACVTHFASAGWHIVMLVTPGKVPAEKKANVDVIEADLTDEKGAAVVMQRILTMYPGVDAALMLVGGFEAGGISSTDDAALERMYDLNFLTAWHVARPLFTHMNERAGGKLVFIGARPALDAKAGSQLVAYGLSKSLLFKLADYFNEASQTVRSHVIVFNALDTPQNRASMPKADRSTWVAPERVAEKIRGVIEKGGEMVVVVGN
jgi:NAD(P)-dependent dehydrogenase (short-subunit alcohol dehydrogenase family)